MVRRQELLLQGTALPMCYCDVEVYELHRSQLMNLTKMILPFGQAYYFCLEGGEVLNKNLYRRGGAVLWSNPLVKHALRTCIANK